MPWRNAASSTASSDSTWNCRPLCRSVTLKAIDPGMSWGETNANALAETSDSMTATGNLRRARVLIAGCGDVGLRCVPLLAHRAAAPRVIALSSQPARVAELRAAGTTPLIGDLDERRSLRRLAGLASIVLHLAPPQKTGDDDTRTRALIAALSAPRRSVARTATSAVARQRAWRGWFRATFKSSKPAGANTRAKAIKRAPIVPDRVSSAAARSWPIRMVYASTSGVYGDCGGAWVDGKRPGRPDKGRAERRGGDGEGQSHGARRRRAQLANTHGLCEYLRGLWRLRRGVDR